MLQEFKKFITRGNVIDLAVGVLIGAAFGKIVNSIVNDILMPPLGLILSNVKFTEIKQRIGGTDAEPVTINTGNFIQTVVEFLIISFIIFLIVKLINSLRKKEEESPTPAPAPPTGEEKLLMEIRDLLKRGNQ
jgi:large conductance mechanosensitive channel